VPIAVAVITGGLLRLVIEMHIHLGGQHALGQSLLQFADNPSLPSSAALCSRPSSNGSISSSSIVGLLRLAMGSSSDRSHDSAHRISYTLLRAPKMFAPLTTLSLKMPALIALTRLNCPCTSLISASSICCIAA
jgi:hypothetical protein